MAGGCADFLKPRTGAPRGRPPVTEAAAKSAAEAAETSASSGSGWWTELETGHPATGEKTDIGQARSYTDRHWSGQIQDRWAFVGTPTLTFRTF